MRVSRGERGEVFSVLSVLALSRQTEGQTVEWKLLL